jgi:4-hydroxybenzoate polyprenyltransferase
MWAYIQLVRPKQWIKNIFVLAALVFSNSLHDAEKVRLSLLAFVAFCMVSSAGYVFNDILDRERDRLHPGKKNRPIARGEIGVFQAGMLSIGLAAGAGLLSGLLLPEVFGLTIALYLLLVIFYSTVLKHRMLLDVIVIAILFVMRALGGALAIEVEVSSWLLICTFMLCLFLGFGKRRCEVVRLGNSNNMHEHRKTLPGYTTELLNHLLSTSGGIAILTFLLYTRDTSYEAAFPNKAHLVYTLPMVVYGVFRYAMLIEMGKATGPTDLIVNDRPFMINLVLWTLATVVILYGGY